MELESKADAFTITLARPSADGLLEAGELGLRAIEAEASVQQPGSTEQALKDLRQQLVRNRGRAVDLTFTRTDATLIERSADKAIRLAPVFGHPVPEGAEAALAALRNAVHRSEPGTKWLKPRRRR